MINWEAFIFNEVIFADGISDIRIAADKFSKECHLLAHDMNLCEGLVSISITLDELKRIGLMIADTIAKLEQSND